METTQLEAVNEAEIIEHEAVRNFQGIPAISVHNARELQQKSVEARKRNQTERKLLEDQEKEAERKKTDGSLLQGQLRDRILRQLDDLDNQWKKQPSARASIAQAQATLWKLLFPQPKASRSRRDSIDQGPV